MIENSKPIGQHRTQRTAAALVAIVAVLVTVGSIWYPSRGGGPGGPMQDPTWDELLAEAKAGGYGLVTTEELAGHLQKDPRHLLIIDTRQEWEFRTRHIKGAVLFPVETGKWWWFRNKSSLARLLGPDKDRTVVFYCSGPA